MSHVNYLQNHININDKIRDILTYLTDSKNDRSILFYYYGKNNRLRYLQFYCRNGYITQERGVFIENEKAVIEETKKHHYITQNYFYPKSSKNLSKALRYLEKSYFYTLKNNKWGKEIDIPNSFLKTTENDFVVRKNIDDIDTCELLSYLQTIFNSLNVEQKQLYLKKTINLFIKE